jgi:SAM-dependent methyltransferase
MGTAQMQGALWGARAREWAELGEPTTRPNYLAVFDRAGVTTGTKLLDVGCGSGLALAIARGRGAEVAGLDASEALVGIARQRLPGARIEVGDMESLPFDDHSFDLVTSFTSLQFAGDRIQALREARRVCCPGGRVAMLVWGRRDDCEMTATTNAVLALLPPSPTPPGQPIGDPGVLESLMSEAGLRPVGGGDVDCPFIFPDLDTAIRTMRSAGMVAKAEEIAGEEPVVQALRNSLRSLVRPDGSVVQRNRFRWVMGERRMTLT